MTKDDLKTVFFGTPDFAMESLRALVEGGYQVVGVVTAPDKPVGRHGAILQPSAVKQYALSQGLPVLQPEKLQAEDFIEALRSLRPDLQIVVAFRMLPEAVWAMPRFGTFNLHASLLPQYRGAAPINRAVINGEKETGVTTFFLTHGMDTGRIILQKRIPIAETDDVGVVHDALMTIGALLVKDTVDLLIAYNGNIATIPQETLYETTDELRAAPKIFKETCRINWHQPVKRIYDFIRGLSPLPTAWTELEIPEGALHLKIFQSEMLPESHHFIPGTFRTDGKKYLDVAAEDGFIRLLSLQPAGKKRMTAKDFLNGRAMLKNAMHFNS